ncbi:hypothetical protein Taro_051213 [Colocasia esculenta]|uniref:Uncharacterized protein n=1 Tax=Colocasia esculenta TaxID=4460 RepID=A0A843XGA3_COLES|nr:hypothetical protein [Colocasia esculenta]
MNLTSGENQSGSAVNEKGGVRTDQGIPISSNLRSSDLSKAIGRHLVYCLTKYVSYSSGMCVPGIYSSAQVGPSTARPRRACLHLDPSSLVTPLSLQLSTSGYQSSGHADLELGVAHPVTILMGSTDE